MLEPDTRYLLLDCLRPPPGYDLDTAAGTTFTLNLDTLTTVPLAFAMFDHQRKDGSLAGDAVTTLQALRQNADRITLFTQAGQIGVHREYRSIFVYLEDSIYPVVSSDLDAIFHPKVWYLRYRSKQDGHCTYRLLCLSRNLTFDRSWDTVLRLDGDIGNEILAPELDYFAQSLLEMAEPVRPVPEYRAKSIRQLGKEFSRVQWRLPDNFDSIKFWPLGIPGKIGDPVPDHYERILIVSPFLTQEPIWQLTKPPEREQSIVLSRPESFESLGAIATNHLTERLVLASNAASPDEAEEGEDPSTDESVAESARGILQGLHAKLYVMDQGDRSRILTGSANATWPGFNRNVEFLVELSGLSEHVGVQATIGDQNDRLGLRALVEPFDPSNDEAQEPTEVEEAKFALDKAGRLLGRLRFIARCTEIDGDKWRLSLEGHSTRALMDGPDLNEIPIRVRPITLRPENEKPPAIVDERIAADFELTKSAITPFFAFSLTLGEQSSSFLITADLIDPPPDREADVLRNLLENPRDFVRLLLLLLGNIDDALATSGADNGTGLSRQWLTGFGSDALLEPLVRAFARDPQRLRDVQRLLEDLCKANQM
jgi:hypothetical protein